MSNLLAMMLKPKKNIYAIIKGTLTENNGIFSGFSENNYLQINNLTLSQIFEIKIKFKTTVVNERQTLIGNIAGGILRLVIFTDGYLELNLGISFSAFDIGTIRGTTLIQTNTDYYAKIVFNGYQYTLLLSTDDENYNIEGTLNSIALINNGEPFTATIGAGNITVGVPIFLEGSLDLNKSYIKIMRTIYEYSLGSFIEVGTPTIVDGIASNFSDNDYLQLPNIRIDTDYEIRTKFKLNSLPTQNNVIGTHDDYSQLGFILYSNYLQCGIRYSYDNNTERYNSIISINWETNKDYYVKAILINNTYQCFLSTDNINWIAGNIINIPKNAIIQQPSTGSNNSGRLQIGGGTQYNSIDGFIDLNETLIKVGKTMDYNIQAIVE